MESVPHRGSLVAHKGRPARVVAEGKALEIELPGGERLSVRLKDVTFLHPGPLASLASPAQDQASCPGETALGSGAGEVEAAWELLAGTTTDLAELAELAFGTYSPATAWSAYRLLLDGLHFRGTPQEIVPRSPTDLAREIEARRERAAEGEAWSAFLANARARRLSNEDRRFLREVEDLALGRRDRSRVLRELKRAETPESAHHLLLELGAWDETADPYPQRMGVPTSRPELDVPALPQDERLDLTHLPAYAIDDPGNLDPDDALSLEGRRLWVHVADASALVPPGSPLDLDARGRGATLYLPEGRVPMLPEAAVRLLGLGLSEVSPALSFALDLAQPGVVQAVEPVPTLVRVTRLTYEAVEERLGEQPFLNLWEIAQAHRALRVRQGAVSIELPEVKIAVRDGRVEIAPLPALRSRDLVAEAMLMAGAAVGRLAVDRGLPLPYGVQEPPDGDPGSPAAPGDLAAMLALRQTMRPGQHSLAPGRHAGLGLEPYVQVTSPLRRYLDLVVHQQLRAALLGRPALSTSEVLERIGATAALVGSLRQAERLARRHWTLVYLRQHPGWEGEGIVVDRTGRTATVLIPALDLDCRVHLRRDPELNDRLTLAQPEVRLPELDVRFRVL